MPFQILDYLRSELYGPGIPLSNINLQSIIDCANLCRLQDTSYDYTWNKYWRYTGWKTWSNSNRDKLQTNVILDTSNTIFKNIQGMLAQGIMALNNFNGQYYLTMERDAPAVVEINGDELLSGNINITDTTGTTKYNSVQGSILDPANGWKSTAVTFFNSTYLAEDNYVEKKMSLTLDYLTNYYTTRAFVERELKKSRFTRTVDIQLPFKYFGLLPNDPVTLTYKRYGFVNKKFLVDEIDYYSNGRYSITLQEYESDVFINSTQTDNSTNQVPTITNLILPPTNLQYTPEGALGIDHLGINGYLSWNASKSPKVTYYSVYISGVLDPIIVDAQSGVTSYSIPLSDMAAGNYTIEVRAVDVQGFRSKAATLSFYMNASFNLSIVQNFTVTNKSTDDQAQFVGSSVDLYWDVLKESSYITGIYYKLEIYDNTGVLLRNVSITNANTYSYLLSYNKADHLSQKGSLGIYREFRFKIKAYGPNGEESIAYAEIL